MGSVKPDRELSLAWNAYSAAVRQLVTAMRRFEDAGVPLDPGRNFRSAPAWTAEHVQAVVDARAAWRHLVATRYAYDQLRRRILRE